MEATVNKTDLQKALGALKMYFNSANVWPYVSIYAGDGGVWLYATDKAVYTSYWIAADVREDSEVTGLIGAIFSALVSSTNGEMVHLTSTDKGVTVSDDHKFKGRLQVATDMTSLSAMFLGKKDGIASDFSTILPIDGLERVLRLSTAFPAHTASSQRWITLSSQEDDCVGSIQETEIGGIDALPLGAAEMQGSGSIQMRSPVLQSICNIGGNLGGDRLSFQTGANRHSLVLITDPDFPNWWVITAQYLRPGEKVD